MEDIEVKYNKKKITFKVKRLGFYGRIRGLMFRKNYNTNLLFDFGKSVNYSIHSLFVFFDFIVLWLDDKNKILKIDKVSPFKLRVNPGIKYSKFIEIPSSETTQSLISFFVDSRKI